MLDYLIRIKTRSDYQGAGMAIIILKILSFTLTYNKEGGDHLYVGIGFGTFEIGIETSIWRKLLP